MNRGGTSAPLCKVLAGLRCQSALPLIQMIARKIAAIMDVAAKELLRSATMKMSKQNRRCAEKRARRKISKVVKLCKNLKIVPRPIRDTRLTRRNLGPKQTASPNPSLVYIRARYYNSQLGQFISRDPLGYVDGMSQYRAYFVPGAVDPFGMEKIKCRCGNGGNVWHWIAGGKSYRESDRTIECGKLTPQKCCKAECDANKGRGPNNITLYYVGFEYVEPVRVNLDVYIWPGSKRHPKSYDEDVLEANRILKPTGVELNLRKCKFEGRTQPGKNLADNNSPVVKFIANLPEEIQVHVVPTLQSNGETLHGWRSRGAVLLADSGNGQTLAHELGHYFGILHDEHNFGYLMNEKAETGANLTQQDIIDFRKGAVGANRRQENGEPSPFIYQSGVVNGSSQLRQGY